jgi:hypothetical protein
MRRAENVASMGENRNAETVWLQDLGVDEKIILTCVLEKNNVKALNDFIWLSIGARSGLL